MSAVEFDLWADYYRRHGFPADRIEATTANAGAAVAQTWGGRVKAHDLIPRFEAAEDRRARLRAWLESLPPPAEVPALGD